MRSMTSTTYLTATSLDGFIATEDNDLSWLFQFEGDDSGNPYPGFIAGVGVLFDWWNAGGTVQSLATIPEATWELILGVYCTIWGFRKDSPIVRPNWRGNATA